jgi:hypothetical protein
MDADPDLGGPKLTDPTDRRLAGSLYEGGGGETTMSLCDREGSSQRGKEWETIIGIPSVR